MKSIREIYKIGKGPSSSHTMGPARAAKLFKEQYPNADCYRVVLYGSLSKTGVGHGTDRVLREVLSPTPTEVIFSDEVLVGLHSNTMDLIALEGSTQIGTLRIESIGGGDIRVPGQRFTPERKNAPPNLIDSFHTAHTEITQRESLKQSRENAHIAAKTANRRCDRSSVTPPVVSFAQYFCAASFTPSVGKL